ncbi:hypothetical protein ACWEKT_07755 [Nocardia takedensis]|uniref:hypothetical protein n=1 Tax=Nocardia takedensis TaxID=259390 RepID=UPI0002EC8F08|nr:hypothetical protein [Nocardia takedensis]
MRISAGHGLSAIGAAAAALAVAAPQAAAAPGYYTMSLSSATIVAGCAYTLSIDEPPSPASASFYDNGTRIGSTSGSAYLTGELETRWTPAAAGSHTLTASVGYLSAAVWVEPLTVQVAADGTCSGGGFSSLLPSLSG